MEYGSIEREFRIDASPEVVYDVVSRPGHIRQWWDAETALEPAPGESGELVWTDATTGRTQAVAIKVVDAVPPRLFSFRWTHPVGDAPTRENSLLVTFELLPSGAGTTLRLTETGFREVGWEAAALEEQYHEHSIGWSTYLARLRDYATRLVSSS